MKNVMNGIRVVVLILIYIFGILAITTLFSTENSSLTIGCLNSKNDDSQDYGIRVKEIYVDGTMVDFKDLELPAGWQIVDGMLAGYSNSEDITISIASNVEKDVRIVYIKQRVLGYMQINLGNDRYVIDAYADTDWEETDIAYNVRSSKRSGYIYLGIEGLLVIVFTVCVALNGNTEKKKVLSNRDIKPDVILEKFGSWFQNEKKWAFISAFLGGVMVYAIIMINQPVTADPVLFMDIFKSSDYFLYNQGRWSTNLFTMVRAYIADPILSTLITIFAMSVYAALICDIFRIKGKLASIVIGLAVVTHPYVANAMMYYSTDGTIVYFMPAIAILVLYRTNLKKILKIGIASIIYALTIGTGQSTISTITFMAVCVLLIDIIEQTDKRWKNFFNNVISCAIGCVIYAVIWIILAKTHNIDNFYGGTESYGILNTLLNLPTAIAQIYTDFVTYLFGNDGRIIHNMYWHRDILNVILVLCAALNAIVYMVNAYKKKTISLTEIVVFVLFICMLPLAAISISIIVTNYSFYLMMANAFILLIPFLCKLCSINSLQSRNARIGECVSIIIIAAITWTFSMSDIAGYRYVNHTYTQTKQLASRLLYRIENLEGFTYDMPVCFVGQPSSECYNRDEKLYQASPGGTFSAPGVFSGIWENSDGWGLYIYRYSGVKLNYYSNGMQSEIRRLAQTDEFRTAESYPSKDSIKIIDGVVVVKLGEYDDTLPD